MSIHGFENTDQKIRKGILEFILLNRDTGIEATSESQFVNPLKRISPYIVYRIKRGFKKGLCSCADRPKFSLVDLQSPSTIGP
jgi:hypothetical protein